MIQHFIGCLVVILNKLYCVLYLVLYLVLYICYSFTFIGFRMFSDKFCSCAPISLCTACARAVWMPEENFTCFLSVDTKYIVNLYIKNTFKLKMYQVTCYSDGIQESDMSPLFPFVSWMQERSKQERKSTYWHFF